MGNNYNNWSDEYRVFGLLWVRRAHTRTDSARKTFAIVGSNINWMLYIFIGWHCNNNKKKIVIIRNIRNGGVSWSKNKNISVCEHNVLSIFLYLVFCIIFLLFLLFHYIEGEQHEPRL